MYLRLFTIFLLLGSNNIYGNNFIYSLKDLNKICSENSDICNAFFSGIINGYNGANAIRAEYKLAYYKKITRKDIADKIDTDTDMHNQLTQISNDLHFVCLPNNINTSDIAKNVLKNIPQNIINSDLPAYYHVTNSLSKIYPCEIKSPQ